jgi:hypothetical protein
MTVVKSLPHNAQNPSMSEMLVTTVARFTLTGEVSRGKILG